MANIGKNIKQFRIQKNLTQDQLAEQLLSVVRRYPTMKIVNRIQILICL